MARKRSEAATIAASWVGRQYPAGWCQKWVVTEVYASGGVGDWDGDGRADAEDGWKAARERVATTDPASIPAGYPIYFEGGARDDGHAAISAGRGLMYSTDLPKSGTVGLVPIAAATKAWGVRLLGYVLVDGHGNDFRDPATTAAAPTIKPPRRGGEGAPMIYLYVETKTGQTRAVFAHNGGFVLIPYTPEEPKPGAKRTEYQNLVAAGVPVVWRAEDSVANHIADARGLANR